MRLPGPHGHSAIIHESRQFPLAAFALYHYQGAAVENHRVLAAGFVGLALGFGVCYL